MQDFIVQACAMWERNDKSAEHHRRKIVCQMGIRELGRMAEDKDCFKNCMGRTKTSLM